MQVSLQGWMAKLMAKYLKYFNPPPISQSAILPLKIPLHELKQKHAVSTFYYVSERVFLYN
jgi:hypothetical protein